MYWFLYLTCVKKTQYCSTVFSRIVYNKLQPISERADVFIFTAFNQQIYQLPEWRLVFLVKNFPVGQRVLVDSSSGQSATQGDGKKEEVARQGEFPLVREVALVSLGNNCSRPYLLVRVLPQELSVLIRVPVETANSLETIFLVFKVYVENELLIYEAFPYDQQQPQNNLKVRFKKVQAREDEGKARQISFTPI